MKIIRCLRFLKLSPWTFLFVLKNIFWLCLFPTILWTQKWVPQIQKFGQKWEFSPKSSKINKNWFFFLKFLWQNFRVPPEVSWVWFLGSYNFFSPNYDILNKTNFLTKFCEKIDSLWNVIILSKKSCMTLKIIPRVLQEVL